MMSLQSKRELLSVVAPRYRKADREEKSRILDEFVESTGYGRKHALALLNHPPPKRPSPVRRRPRRYTRAVSDALVKVWNAADQICSKRLIPFLPDFIEALERHGELRLEEEIRSRLLSISPASADRLLQPERRRLETRGRSTTKPGTLLKDQIPIRTFADWDDARPGFMELDLVAHCGESTQGEYLHSLVLTDIATGWTECAALQNKSQITVCTALEAVRQRLPFALSGIDSDNGSEFINAHLLRYCREHQVTFTRCRPYKKNDQCHVEQKNWCIVRQKVGYRRYEGKRSCQRLARLYEPLRLYTNFFQPSLKLVEKTRNGARVHKRYDTAKTPTQRVLASPEGAEGAKALLREQFLTLNPLELLRQIERLQEQFWITAVGDSPLDLSRNEESPLLFDPREGTIPK